VLDKLALFPFSARVYKDNEITAKSPNFTPLFLNFIGCCALQKLALFPFSARVYKDNEITSKSHPDWHIKGLIYNFLSKILKKKFP